MLAQLAVDRKENEMVAVPKLLKQLDVTGMVVVGDAMQAQRELSIQVVEAQGVYLCLRPHPSAPLRPLMVVKRLCLCPGQTAGLCQSHAPNGLTVDREPPTADC